MCSVSRPGDDYAAIGMANKDDVAQIFVEQQTGDIGDMRIESDLRGRLLNRCYWWWLSPSSFAG